MEVSDIEEYLLKNFHNHFDITIRASVGDLNLQEHQKEESSIYDDKACTACKLNGRQLCKTQEVAKFQAGTNNVLTIDIEDFLTKYSKHLLSSRCDLLHTTEGFTQFVLNELTCTRPEYVEPYYNKKGHQAGKREKARNQMEEVVKLLNKVPVIHSYIEAFDKKVALFSWRNPMQDEASANKAEQSMIQFGMPLQLVSNITTLGKLSNNFVFVQQLYPAVYQFG